jgi:hypothetical protein
MSHYFSTCLTVLHNLAIGVRATHEYGISSLATGVAAEVQPTACGVKLKGWASMGACPPMSLSQANATKDANVQTSLYYRIKRPHSNFLSIHSRNCFQLIVFAFSISSECFPFLASCAQFFRHNFPTRLCEPQI